MLKVGPGDQIKTYSPKRNWAGIRGLAQNDKVLGDPSRTGLVPVASILRSGEYRTVPVGTLTQSMVIKTSTPLSIQEDNVGILWKLHSSDEWESMKKKQTPIWVNLNPGGHINEWGYGDNERSDVKLKILDDNQLMSSGCHLNLMAALEIYNWIILSEQTNKNATVDTKLAG